jgi:hypothetical protein
MKKSVKMPKFSVAKGSLMVNNELKLIFLPLFSSQSWISANTSKFHHSTIPSFHPSTIPFPPKLDFGYHLNIPLFHYSIIPFFHSFHRQKPIFPLIREEVEDVPHLVAVSSKKLGVAAPGAG